MLIGIRWDVLAVRAVGVGVGAEIVPEWSAERVNNLFRNVSILNCLQSVWVRTACPLPLRRWVDVHWVLRILRAARSSLNLFR